MKTLPFSSRPKGAKPSPKRLVRLVFERAALVFFALFLALLFCEALLRLFVDVPLVGPASTRYDPVYGKRLKAGLQCTRKGREYEARLSINSFGFRGPQWERLPQRPVLFLGDSFTFAAEVSDGQEFPALIQKDLRKTPDFAGIDVINAGIGDNGQGYWLKFLQNRGPELAPRLVVLQHCNNDFTDNLRERLYELEQGRLRELPVPPPSTMRRVQRFIEAVPGLSHSYLTAFIRRIHFFLHPKEGNERFGAGQPQPSDDLTYALVAAVLDMASKQGWPVIGVSVYVTGERLERLAAMYKEYGFPFLPIPIPQERPDLYYDDNGHWTPEGQVYVAQELLELMRPLLRKEATAV